MNNEQQMKFELHGKLKYLNVEYRTRAYNNNIIVLAAYVMKCQNGLFMTGQDDTFQLQLMGEMRSITRGVQKVRILSLFSIVFCK